MTATAVQPVSSTGTLLPPVPRRRTRRFTVQPPNLLRALSISCPAKTNLRLHVGGRKAAWGGRHALSTTYCAVGIYDTVTVREKAPGTGFSLEISGTYLGDLASSNSDMRRNHAVLALFALAQACGREPDIALSINKRIPVGGGLGGGSADASATLLALNMLWNLDWPIERLREVAATLGADMPFCLTGGYAYGSGYGELISDIAPGSLQESRLRRCGYAGNMLVGAYHAQLSTAEVYAAFDALGPKRGDENDLQQAAIALHPQSGAAIDAAIDAGASHAFISGSGPSVIAFTPDRHATSAVQSAWQRLGVVDRIIAAQAPVIPRIAPQVYSL